MLIAETDFGRFAIPRSVADRWPSRTVLNGRRWEPETTDAVCQYATRGGSMVHAGAFFGDALPALSQAVGRAGVVMAFEPNEENYEAAKKTIELNGLQNVELYCLALGSGSGLSKIRTHAPDGVALGSVSRIANDGNEVGMVTTDSVVGDRNVSVIHLDVEGYELHALGGAVRTVNRCLPALVLEAWRGAEPFITWCSQNVLVAEYNLVREVEGNVILEVSG